MFGFGTGTKCDPEPTCIWFGFVDPSHFWNEIGLEWKILKNGVWIKKLFYIFADNIHSNWPIRSNLLRSWNHFWRGYQMTILILFGMPIGNKVLWNNLKTNFGWDPKWPSGLYSTLLFFCFLFILRRTYFTRRPELHLGVIIEKQGRHQLFSEHKFEPRYEKKPFLLKKRKSGNTSLFIKNLLGFVFIKYNGRFLLF